MTRFTSHTACLTLTQNSLKLFCIASWNISILHSSKKSYPTYNHILYALRNSIFKFRGGWAVSKSLKESSQPVGGFAHLRTELIICG